MPQAERLTQPKQEHPLRESLTQRVGHVMKHLQLTGKTKLDVIDVEHILGAGGQTSPNGALEYAFAGGVFPDNHESHRSLDANRLQIALWEGQDIGLYRCNTDEKTPLVRIGALPSKELERVFGSHTSTTESVASSQKSIKARFLPLELRLAQTQMAGEPLGFEETAALLAHPHFSRISYEAMSHILREAAFPIV
jgi:hypothetical protein